MTLKPQTICNLYLSLAVSLFLAVSIFCIISAKKFDNLTNGKQLKELLCIIFLPLFIIASLFIINNLCEDKEISDNQKSLLVPIFIISTSNKESQEPPEKRVDDASSHNLKESSYSMVNK